MGEVGYANHKRGIEPRLANMPELGWVLATTFHGRDYATEAVHAATTWGEVRFGGQQTVCIIHPENAHSIRVAAKCGFIESARTSYKGEPTIVFTR